MTTDKNEQRAALSVTLRKHLEAIEACERSGEPLKRYAERKGLSIHTLYQAKKELRKKGVLPPPSPARGKSPRTKRTGLPRASRFVKAVPRAEGAVANTAWRLRLPTGVVFESTTPITADELARLMGVLGGGS